MSTEPVSIFKGKGYFIPIGIGLILGGVAYVYRDRIQNYIGVACQGAQQGTQAPHLGELNTSGIIKFQKWANGKYNLGLGTDGAPDATTTSAYTSHGREFITALTDAFNVSSAVAGSKW